MQVNGLDPARGLAGAARGPMHDFQSPLLSLLLAVVLVGHVVFAVYVLSGSRQVDFYQYYAAGAMVRRGLDFYEPNPERWRALASQVGVRPPRGEEFWRFPYPPFSALLFAPMSLLPERAARLVWHALNYALLILAVFRLAGLMGFSLASPRGRALLLLALSFGPTSLTLLTGQISVLLLFLLTEATLRLSRRQDGWGGFLIGITVGVKVLTAPLLLYLLWKGRWKAAAAGVAALLGTVVIAALAIGPDYVGAYFGGVFLGQVAWLPSEVFNQSLAAFFLRLDPAHGERAWVPLGISVALVGLASLAVCDRRGRGERRMALELGLLVAAILLVSPISWDHYQILLLPLLGLSLFGYPSMLGASRETLRVVALTVVLSTIQVAAYPYAERAPLLVSLGLYSTLILWSYTALRLARGEGQAAVLAAGARYRPAAPHQRGQML